MMNLTCNLETDILSSYNLGETLNNIRQDSLDYHAGPIAGKLAISVTKPISNQYELTLAYSPGVAEPVKEIAKDHNLAYKYTSKGNMVAIISNGTAILGLGNLGALASKPVMEGKAALFKILAGVDAFDIEVDQTDPDKFIETVRAISPTFGAINLEDIKAPECFIIEERLQNIGIPVMHDDQHGTAIVIAAGLLNACHIQGCNPKEAKIVVYGAGAAAIASVKLLHELGFDKNKIFMLDSKGVVRKSRDDLNIYKRPLALDTDASTFLEAMDGANILIGLAGAEMPDARQALESMSAKPITFLLSNPTPGIPVEVVQEVRPDALIATGRSDYPNQINNALCFPYLFKGALLAKAEKITLKMKIAAVNALKDLAREEVPDYIKHEYKQENDIKYGRNYIIPKPTDKRLRKLVSEAVAEAAK